MPYAFLTDTYDTERIKVVSVWSEFTDQELPVRPRQGDPRGRSVHEQMVHQCVSEDLGFRNMLGVDVGAPPLPQQETRLAFINRYAEDSGKRLAYSRVAHGTLPMLTNGRRRSMVALPMPGTLSRSAMVL